MKKILLLLLAALTLSSCHDERLTIMSLNIRYNGVWEDDGDNAWQYRREAMAAMILEEMPDAIGMQEVLPD